MAATETSTDCTTRGAAGVVPVPPLLASNNGSILVFLMRSLFVLAASYLVGLVPWLPDRAFFADHSLVFLGMILRYMASLYLRSPFVDSLRIPCTRELSFSVVVAFVNKDRSILHGRPFLTRRASCCCCCCRRSMMFRLMSIALLHTKKQATRAPAQGKSEGKIILGGGSRSARIHSATNEAATIAVSQQMIAPCLGRHSSFYMVLLDAIVINRVADSRALLWQCFNTQVYKKEGDR
jgi:hypothetical protein